MWGGDGFCNNLLQTLRRAKSRCRSRLGSSWHRENFLPGASLCPLLFLDVCQWDRAPLGNSPSFPFSNMFTFAAFCYMLSLVLCVSLIFFAIWHVSSTCDLGFWSGIYVLRLSHRRGCVTARDSQVSHLCRRAHIPVHAFPTLEWLVHSLPLQEVFGEQICFSSTELVAHLYLY